ncbi:glycosyltransferase [bacterium]|nr:glycosyltransferase [bacterium]
MGLAERPFISVIVATLNRIYYLQKCLRAILANAYDEYEIIVVDQGEEEQTKGLLDSQFSDTDRITYIHTDTIGLSYARNLGWKKARGEIIAFIDDDAIPVSGWLEAYARVFSEVEPTPAVAGGRIEPVWEVPKPKWYPKEREFLLATYDIGDEVKPFPEFDLPIGANFAVLRKIIEDFCGFDDRVGFDESRKKSMIAGEDTLIGLRAREAGYRIYYQPAAKVFHHISAKKLSRRYFLRRHFWEGVTQIALEECRNNTGHKRLRTIFLWHARNILKEGILIGSSVVVGRKNGPSKPMLHLSLIAVSIGICVKSAQLMLNKRYRIQDQE